MKIIHTSDWHIGHTLYNYDRSAEFEAMLTHIADIVHRESPDALLISGDIFHYSSPSATAQRLFVDSLLKIQQANPDMDIIATAGNHDSPSRIDADTALWAQQGISVIGAAIRRADESLDPDRHIIRLSNGKGVVVALPYISPHFLDMTKIRELIALARSSSPAECPIIVMAHLYTAGADTTGHDDDIGGLECVALSDFGSDYDYLALGHIHRPQDIKGSNGKARYCGTPLAVSFDEIFPHGVSIVELSTNKPPLIRFEEIEPTVPLKTIPAKPAPIDMALKELADLPDDLECYVRLNVLVKDFLPSSCQFLAADILKEKAAHLCYVMPTREDEATQKHDNYEMNIDEFKKTSPIDIAMRFYHDKHGSPIPQQHILMLQEIISELEQNAEQ